MQSIITQRLGFLSKNLAKTFTLIIFSFFVYSGLQAQFDVNCPSKDLQLAEARIGGANLCVSCEPGSTITKALILKIYNKTGSKRTAFAFWGYLRQKNAAGQQVGDLTLIQGCDDINSGTGILPGDYTEVTFPEKLTYTCGNSLEIVSLVMAWTDASKNSVCSTLTVQNISPKCGTLPVVPINAGLVVSGVVTNGTCGNGTPTKGSIDLSAVGGVGNLSYSWVGPSFSSSSPDISNLNAGLYTVTVTDQNSPTPCSKIATFNVTVPAGVDGSAVPTNGTCNTTTGVPGLGSIDVTPNPTGTYTYVWSASNGGSIPAGQEGNQDLTGLSAGTYSVTFTNGDGCKKQLTGIPVTVQSRPANAAISKVDPTLCGPSSGSITVCSPTGTGIQYSKDGGTTWQAGPTFGSLAAGSNPSILVKNSAGCWSATPTPCTSAAACVTTAANNPLEVVQEQNMTSLGSGELEAALSVRAMPNPFSDQVRFMIKSAYSGVGSLDIYNLQGQKVKTVYSGYIRAGSSYFDLKIADNVNTSQLIYVLSINGEKVTGKLLRTNR
jgi:hypothetical protein